MQWKQIAKDSDVYKIGFGAAPGLVIANPGSYRASAVYVSENLPQAGSGIALGGYGEVITQPTGNLSGQWIAFDISGALASAAPIEGQGDAGGIGGGAGFASTVNARKAVYDYVRLNTISAIQYNPGLFSGSVADTGLLYAKIVVFPGGALAPLAGFNSPPKLTLYG